MAEGQIPKVNLKELRKQRRENFLQRLAFIDAYVEWLKRTPNKVWSKQQAEMVDQTR